jgi:hypothetical protein
VEYDYSEDYLKFLDDKAVCPGAAEMSKFWFSGDRKETRRLLQKILSLPDFDTRALVDRLRKGRFTPDEYVMELTQKERELKVSARCFCKLPFTVRTFFTSTEYNLKEHFMKKYMPQQTMTMSNNETRQRMYDLVKNARAKDRTLLEVDFSRWNLRWREETVNPIASQLEDIFGLEGVFSQAHPFFTRATIVMTDKHSLPPGADPNKPVTEWPTSNLLSRNDHYGGLEGIQQGLWTKCTIAMMYWVLHDQNVSFCMAGQGDNQIFAITFDTTNKEMADQLRKLLAVMEIRCKLLNHEVKPDECIDSRTVLTYSKDIYVNGNHILYNLKFASRTFRRDEIDIPSLSTEISAVSACSVACADSVYDTPRAIFWKTFQTIRLLSQRFRSPNHETEKRPLAELLSNPGALTFALLLPGSLGGLPCMSWSRFFLKGEADDLTWDVCGVRGLMKGTPNLAHDLRLTLDGTYTPKHPDLTQLVLDPHSIPLNRPKDMKRLIKDAVAKELPGITANRWIYELIRDTDDAAGGSLMRALVETRPFYPEIMSDLYSLSPSGVRDALFSRFTMTRTIMGVAGNPNFISEIETANARLLNFVLTRYRSANEKIGIPTLPDSGYKTCVELRHLWGLHVDNKNIGVYCPLDFRLKFTDTTIPMISVSSRCNPLETLDTSLGPYPPNFGTQTRQKLSDHGFKITTSSSTVLDLKRLTAIFSELGSSHSLAGILSQITRARSPWTMPQLATVLPTNYGGAAAHRHEKINQAAFSLLGSRTVPTHLNFCSDAAGILSGGESDYPIVYQEHYLKLTNLYQVLTRCNVLDVNSSIGYHMTDNYEPLPADGVECSIVPTLKWGVSSTNKLCFVTELSIREMPRIPPAQYVAPVDVASLRPSVIIYNKMLSKYTSQRRLFKTTAAVNLPVELVDMKEFSHCPIDEMLRGMTWFIQAMSIYASVNEYTAHAHTVLHDVLMRTSVSCAAILARSMLHPSFITSQYSREHSIYSHPGVSGARHAADNLAGVLYQRTVLSMRAREFITSGVPLILFVDYEKYISIAAEIHTTLLISLQSFDTGKILVTSRQRLYLRAARNGVLTRANGLLTALNFKSTLEMIARTHPRTLRHNADPRTSNGTDLAALDGFKVTLLYSNTSAEEAIRTLRSAPMDIRQPAHRPQLPEMRHILRSLQCQLIRDTTDGSLKPQHTCPVVSDEMRIIERFQGHCRRPYGQYATATSIWLPILYAQARRKRYTRALTIGVGHGASAASLLMSGVPEVIGIDLRDSFPCISQREATYKPPEVMLTGQSSQFHWSDFVSRHGGDVLKNSSSLPPKEQCDIWVVDIEQSHDQIWSLLERVPIGITLILRQICCREWAQYLIDALGVDRIYNTSIGTSHHKRSYVFVVDKLSIYNSQANYKRTTIATDPAWDQIIRPNQRYSRAIFNAFLQPLGEEIMVVSAPDILTIAESLRTRALNSQPSAFTTRLTQASNSLFETVNLMRSLIPLTKQDILDATPDTRRLLAAWIANTGLAKPDLEA